MPASIGGGVGRAIGRVRRLVRVLGWRAQTCGEHVASALRRSSTLVYRSPLQQLLSRRTLIPFALVGVLLLLGQPRASGTASATTHDCAEFAARGRTVND